MSKREVRTANDISLYTYKDERLINRLKQSIKTLLPSIFFIVLFFMLGNVVFSIFRIFKDDEGFNTANFNYIISTLYYVIMAIMGFYLGTNYIKDFKADLRPSRTQKRYSLAVIPIIFFGTASYINSTMNNITGMYVNAANIIQTLLQIFVVSAIEILLFIYVTNKRLEMYLYDIPLLYIVVAGAIFGCVENENVYSIPIQIAVGIYLSYWFKVTDNIYFVYLLLVIYQAISYIPRFINFEGYPKDVTIYASTAAAVLGGIIFALIVRKLRNIKIAEILNKEE